MTPTIRPATAADADLLLRAIDLASEGLIPTLWAEYAPEGMTPEELGRMTVVEEAGEFSHRNALVAETAGQPAGALICYRLPDPPEPDSMPLPPAFKPLKDLEGRVPGWWYINVIAVLPEAQGQGVGAALMDAAADAARAANAPGVALIVAASNGGALRFYTRLGFAEAARCPFDTTAYGAAPTEAILMTKPV